MSASETDRLVTIHGGDYEHTLEISSVRDGITLDYRVASRPELFAKVLQRQAFDVCEFSLSNYIMMRDGGADWLTAIPVFPSRAFRHGTMLVRKDSDIEQFRELGGKRVGISDYSMTAGVWGRGILADHEQLHWSDVQWYSGNSPRFPAPARARVTLIEQDLEEALAAGHLDALFHPRSRDALLPVGLRRFRPLMKDWRQAETSYFATTGIYPISHVLVIPRDTLTGHPGLPAVLVAAYAHGMKRAKQRRLASTFLPWGEATWSETMHMFDDDPMPHGIVPDNITVIGKLQDYLLEQQLICSRQSLDKLFS